MDSARALPIPGRAASWTIPAVFTSTGPDRVPARPPPWLRPTRLGRSVTCGAMRSRTAGPMPGTRRRSSSVTYGPCVSLSSTIAKALAGPIPGRRSSSSAGATLGSTLSFARRGRSATARRASPAETARRTSSRDGETGPLESLSAGSHENSASPGASTRRAAAPRRMRPVPTNRERLSDRFSSTRSPSPASDSRGQVHGSAAVRTAGPRRRGSRHTSVGSRFNQISSVFRPTGSARISRDADPGGRSRPRGRPRDRTHGSHWRVAWQSRRSFSSSDTARRPRT